MRMLDEDDSSNDVEVSWADQQKINEFSRLNVRQGDAQLELEQLQREKEQVDEVFEEVQLMEMSGDFDDDEDIGDDDDDAATETGAGTKRAANEIPFKIGDAFVHVTLEKATELLEREQKRLDDAIAAAQEQVRKGEQEMKLLKVDLYAKFGNNINLERD